MEPTPSRLKTEKELSIGSTTSGSGSGSGVAGCFTSSSAGDMDVCCEDAADPISQAADPAEEADASQLAKSPNDPNPFSVRESPRAFLSDPAVPKLASSSSSSLRLLLHSPRKDSCCCCCCLDFLLDLYIFQLPCRFLAMLLVLTGEGLKLAIEELLEAPKIEFRFMDPSSELYISSFVFSPMIETKGENFT